MVCNRVHVIAFSVDEQTARKIERGGVGEYLIEVSGRTLVVECERQVAMFENPSLEYKCGWTE